MITWFGNIFQYSFSLHSVNIFVFVFGFHHCFIDSMKCVQSLLFKPRGGGLVSKWCLCLTFVTLWIVAHQATICIVDCLLHWQADSLPLSLQGSKPF